MVTIIYTPSDCMLTKALENAVFALDKTKEGRLKDGAV